MSVERQVGDQVLQSPILVFERAQLPELADAKVRVLLPLLGEPSKPLSPDAVDYDQVTVMPRDE